MLIRVTASTLPQPNTVMFGDFTGQARNARQRARTSRQGMWGKAPRLLDAAGRERVIQKGLLSAILEEQICLVLAVRATF